MSSSAAIAAVAVRKAYGPTVAVADVSFSVAAGTVHALLGENGAGKSTLVKLLSGLVQPDAGHIEIFDKAVRFGSPRQAHRAGVQTAFQELTLIPDLTVAENLLLPYQPRSRLGLLRIRHAEATAAAHLAKLGLDDISPRAIVRELDLSIRQKIEIARVVLREPRILLLDEPTSTLSGKDIDWLGGLIAGLKSAGATIVFISHRLAEVRAFCDGLTVLRNGRSVGGFAVGSVTDDEIVTRIIGRSIEAIFPPRPHFDASRSPVLRTAGLSAGRMHDVSLSLRPGEILGVAALQGMGQSDLFRALFGDIPIAGGTVEIGGVPAAFRSPRDAIDAAVGISFVPEERKTEGLFLKLDGCANTTLPVIGRFAKFGIIDVAAERRTVAAALDRVKVDERALFAPARAFSGGNQQKLVLARCLVAGSRLLLLFDPTRGVDIGTKHEIYALIAAFAASGGSVLLYSTEAAEIVHLSHRVLVIYAGRIVRELEAAQGVIDETAMMEAALGSSRLLADAPTAVRSSA